MSAVDILNEMKPGKGFSARAGRSSIAVLVVALLTPASAWAAAGRPSDGDLSPRLAELANPSVRSAPAAKQARILSLAEDGPGSLVREGNRVLVEVRFDHGAAAGLDDLRTAGAKIVNVSRRYQTVTVAAKPEELRALSTVPRVAGATEVLTPITAAGSSCPAGSVVSEGDGQLHAAEARSEFGVNGSGVTVGILSDSFNTATGAVGGGSIATKEADDLSSGDLPGNGNPCGDATPVNVLDDTGSPGADEGRAMAQIVHDLAPGARLAFATAFTSDMFGFAANIRRLAEPVASGGAEAGIIADDVFFLEEPFFQDGPVGVAVNEVAEDGVSYFSAAGNDNVIEAGTGRDIGSWEDEFRESGDCPASIPHYPAPDQYDCMDFNGAGDTGFEIAVRGKGALRIDFQWAEPWYGVNDDFDAYLADSSGQVVAEGENDNPGKTKKPFEVLFWENPRGTTQTVNLVIKRYSGPASPILKFVMLENGSGDVTGTEYPESFGTATVGPTIFGHTGAAGAMSVAAVPFNGGSAPEPYSSRGPVTHYFGAVQGTSPAAKLPSAETLPKPDLAATDCGVTTFFAFESAGMWRFCGTSAAAPHAAAVAALMREAKPSLTPEEVRNALAASAVPVGSFGPNAVGAGLVNAVGALGEVAEPIPPEEEGGTEGEEEEGGTEGEQEGEGGGVEEGVVKTGGGRAALPSEPEPETGAPIYAPVSAKARHRQALRTFLRWHPRRVIRTPHRRARGVFWFGSNETAVRFICRVDRGLFRPCKRRYARRFRLGRHVLRVIARDAAGNFDHTPAVYRFRVKRRAAG